MIVDEILDGASAAMSALSVTTDAGAPAQWGEWQGGALEQCPNDRAFTVELRGGGDRDITGVPGRVDATLTFSIRLLHFNEARSVRAFSSLLAQDIRRVQDVVPVAVRAVDGVGECIVDGEWSTGFDAAANAWLTEIPFRCEYADDLVTS